MLALSSVFVLSVLTSFYPNSWMTFCPEWLTGSPSLDTSNALYLWVYLVVRTLAQL